MILNLQDFPTWIQRQAAAAQGACTTILDFTVGSVMRAIAEANASVALWMQWLILLVLQMTRAATSNGSDLDTYYADFFFHRLAAGFATGAVTLARFTPTAAALVVPGAQVKTIDGTQIFTVTTDTTNAAWNAVLGGYVLAAGVASINVPVVAAVAGSAGNVQAGVIGLIATSITGVDTVTNAAAFTNGLDAETDPAFRARFQLYIQGLSSGVSAAILGAAEGVQQGGRFQLAKNYPSIGFYTLFADDGSGDAPDSFITAVTAAVQAVTSEGVQPYVMRPTIATAAIATSLQIAAGYSRPTAVSNADAALSSFAGNFTIGGGVAYLALPSVILGADTNITGISSLTINGGMTDIAGVQGVLIQATVAAS